MAKLLISLAQESHDVDVLCLSSHPESDADGHRRVRKSAPRVADLAWRSLRDRKSLVHTRFVTSELIDAIKQSDTDIFVADHSYMAESVLAAHGSRAAEVLAVNTCVPEGLIWTGTRGLVGRFETRRINDDELRVARAARSVASYDASEAEYFRSRGITRSYWLDVTLPSAKQIPIGRTAPRLVFLGDRRWAPNQDAFEQILEWWPRIASGIPEAELCIVGAAHANQVRELPEGVSDLGFVDDLGAFMSTCRALAAPIRTGGGVRVKILDAVSQGLPVVSTSAGIGSLGDLLGIEALDGADEFIEKCRHYLTDPKMATEEGDRLFQLNTARWEKQLPHEKVDQWLT